MPSLIEGALNHVEDCPICEFSPGSPYLICLECHKNRPKMYHVSPGCGAVSGGYAICEDCLNEFRTTAMRKAINDFKEKVKYALRTNG